MLKSDGSGLPLLEGKIQRSLTSHAVVEIMSTTCPDETLPQLQRYNSVNTIGSSIGCVAVFPLHLIHLHKTLPSSHPEYISEVESEGYDLDLQRVISKTRRMAKPLH